MRRRDAEDLAIDHGASDTRWAVLVCVLLSLALHAALLAAAATLCAARQRPPAPLAVSLVSGNGGTSSGGAAGGDVDAPAPVHAPPQFEGPPKPVRSAQIRTQAPIQGPRTVGTRRQSASEVAVVATESSGFAEAARSDGVPSHAGERGGDGRANAGGGGRGQPGGTGVGDGLDARAFCISCPEPAYPLIARARGWQGTVEVALLVRADGSVNGASLGRSSGYQALDDAALTVARRSRFHLPADGGLPTPLRGRMEYRFVLR